MPRKTIDLSSSPFGQAGKRPDSLLYQAGSGAKALAGAFIVPIDRLNPSPLQIRQDYDRDALQELSDDIKDRGVLEPLLVRVVGDNQYEIIAGQRRYLAARAAGLGEVPIIVKDMDDRQVRLAMLAENIQRQELTPAEEQQFFQYLIDEFNLSFGQIGELVHKSRMYVSRRMNSELASLQPNLVEVEVEEGADSEIYNTMNDAGVVLSSSQSAPIERAPNVRNRQKAFVYSPRVFTKLATTLDDAFSYLEAGTVEPHVRTRMQEDVAALQERLDRLKSRLAQEELPGQPGQGDHESGEEQAESQD